MVKMLTVLISTLSNSQVFLQMQKLLTNISIYAIFNDQSFNDTLINDIISFEQLGPDIYCAFNIFQKSFFACTLHR